GQPGEVNKLQLSDVVDSQRTLVPRHLGNEVHVGGKPGSRGKLFADIVQAQEQPGAGKDLVVAAAQPGLLLWRSVPVLQQGGEIPGLQVEQRSGRDVSGQRRLRHCGRLICGPPQTHADGADQEDDRSGYFFHSFVPPFAAGAERASKRGRTRGSCSSASCRIGCRAALSRWRRRGTLTSVIALLISLPGAGAGYRFCATRR